MLSKSVFILFILTFSLTLFGQNEDVKTKAEQYIRQGKYQQAITLLESQPEKILNDTNQWELVYWLENLYLLESKWDKIVQMHENISASNQDDTSVLTMSRYFARFPKENIRFIAPPYEMEFKPGMIKTPVVEVTVNGKKYNFWVDTGAGLTVLSSSVAEKCLVKSTFEGNVKGIAATGKELSIGYGVIDSFRIGPLVTDNHPCLIIDHKQLEFRMLGIRVLKVDGIIGWNLLQELAVTIKREPDRILFSQSAGEPGDNINFIWMSYPYVTCTDSTGNALLFGLDTGASRSSLLKGFYNKTDTSNIYRKGDVIHSAGGKIKINTIYFPRAVVMCSNQKIVLEDTPLHPELKKGIFASDGTFGWKELLSYNMYFDFRKGVFLLTR